jgi:hypothetical protein
MTEIKRLGQPVDSERPGDVIFIHGLDGDLQKSWTAPNDTFWPKLLADDCPQLGVWSLGYEVPALARQGNTGMSLSERADNVLDRLRTERLGTGPICFICHSMGGLLVKQMLANAAKTPTFKAFVDNIRGVVFLDTPHGGSGVARFLKALSLDVPRFTVAVEELSKDNRYLDNLNDDYRNIANELGIGTLVYVAAKPSRYFRFVPIRLVEPWLSNPGLPNVKPVKVDEDHASISKPLSVESQVYSGVKTFLLEVLQDAPIGALQQANPESLNMTGPILFIEDVPVQGLSAHVSKRTPKLANPVHLDNIDIMVSVEGIGTKRDAATRWRFAGVNSTDEPLTSLHLSIAGETLLPLSELGCVVYDLHKDPARKIPLYPRLIGQDSTNKNLRLPFAVPGVMPNERFDLEVSYVWPAIINIRKDYWFIDPTNYAASVDRIRFQITSKEPMMKAAYAFRLNIKTNVAEFEGSVSIRHTNDEQIVIYGVDHPKPEVFYILVVEGEMLR